MRQKPENQKPSSEKLRISPKRSRGSGRGLHCAAPEMEMSRIKESIVSAGCQGGGNRPDSPNLNHARYHDPGWF